ncbi:MAG TPA: VOC family protein [Thermoanaerobaculia bacterium]|jgi:glyoxylase I family protein|nr:VOC family protein [Thermoanaerobaculia bacterium]
MSLKDVIGHFSFVVKLNVTDVDSSVKWYAANLQLVHDPRYDVPGWWAQLNVPEMRCLAFGLNKGVPQPGSDTPTFVVPNIAKARDRLVALGVPVTPIQTVPPGVQLAFFKDPDGNQLGLRQNPPQHPQEFV